MAPQNKPRKHGDLDVQAQEAFYQRSSGPVIGQRPVDQSPKKLAALQHIGAIPDRYTSWEQINDEFRYNVEVLGLTEQQTRDKLNLNVKNTNGKYYFAKYERYGAGNYINFREISTDLQPETIADLLQINKMVERAQGPRLKSPEQMLEDAVFAEEDEWGDRPKNKHNKNIVSSKERANATRDAIRERLGGPPKGSPDVYDRGKQVHRGHGFAASKSNAGLAADNIWDEVGSYNVYGHAGKSNNPRIHPDILFEVNAPPTAEFAAWYRDPELRKQRLYPGVPDQLMMAADEYGSEIYGSRGSGRKKTYTVGPATTRGGVINTPPETVPAKADKLFQISSQLAAEQVNRDIEAGKVSFPYERGNEASKKKAGEARAKYTETVRQSIAKPYLDQQSINLDPTSSPNTPITKSTYQFTEKDFTPLQWKEFTAGGGNAAIAQGKKVTEIIDKGRIARRNPNLMPTTPTRVIPSRLDKGLSGAGPIQTRPSPSQIAASIATREPLPTPKPAPPKQIRTEAELDRIFANIVEAPKIPPVSGNFIPRGPVNITPTDRERALAAERANAGKTKAMSAGKTGYPVEYGANLPIPIPTGSQLKQLAPGIKGQLPFAASSAIEPLQRGEPTRALEEVAKGTAIGMAIDPIVKPIMSRLIPAVGSVAAAAPMATTAAAAVASELAAPRAAQGGPERVTVNGTPYWLDKKANKVYTNEGRPTSFGVDIKGGKPQLVPRGQGTASKKAEADPIRQAMRGNLMPALNMLNPMSQLLRFSNSAMKTIHGEV